MGHFLFLFVATKKWRNPHRPVSLGRVVTYAEIISKSVGESQKVTLNVNLKVLTILNETDDTATG